jgi:hypothetical protein
MPLKTGSSHALATLILTVISAILIEFLRELGFISVVISYLDGVAGYLSNSISNTFNVPISGHFFSIVLTSSILAFVWGMVFHVSRGTPK